MSPFVTEFLSRFMRAGYFFGGPLDGEVRMIPHGMHQWRVPIAPQTMFIDASPLPMDHLPSIRYGLYEQDAVTQRWEWLGIR